MSNAAAVRRAERGVKRRSGGREGGKRVRSVTIGAARRQVLLRFDSLWSVHLSQMSSFIIAELYRTRRTDEMYSEGLDKGLGEIESAGYGVSDTLLEKVQLYTNISNPACQLERFLNPFGFI